MGNCGQLGADLWTDIDDADHVRKFSARRHIEPQVCLLHRTGGGKRTKRLALFNHRIDAIPHFRSSRIGQDASIAERPRTIFHPAPIPCDHSTVRDQFGGGSACGLERTEMPPLNLAVEAAKCRFDFGIVVFGTKERGGKPVVRNRFSQAKCDRARLPEQRRHRPRRAARRLHRTGENRTACRSPCS